MEGKGGAARKEGRPPRTMARQKIEKSFLILERGFEPDFDARQAPFFFPDKIRGLYELGFMKADADETPSWLFMRKLSRCFLLSLFRSPGLELARERVQVVYDDLEVDELLGNAPYMLGSQHLCREWAQAVFKDLEGVFREEIKGFDGTVELYFQRKDKSLSLPSRIFFHLVENPSGASRFAFVATYSTIDREGKLRHFPLKYALYEYAGSMGKLTALIAAIRRAAARSAFIGRLLETGEIFHPLNLGVDEAYAFLKDVQIFEEAGIVVRIPQWWKSRGARTLLSMDAGPDAGEVSGSIMVLRPSMVYEGVPITPDEVRDLLKRTEGLAVLKGKWVEVDKKRLGELLESFDRMEGGLPLVEAVRLASGIEDSPVPVRIDLAGALRMWEKRFHLDGLEAPQSFRGVLRPYQTEAYRYLSLLRELGLGMLLADDMGLGKTVEVLSFLERIRLAAPESKVLLVVPASLLANWQAEARRFVPEMETMVFHGKAAAQEPPFLTITTYQTGSKSQRLREREWDVMILDEAQNIKNPATAQSRDLKGFKRKCSIALTGTPIENRLLNLWSIFDFIMPGLLGSLQMFKGFEKVAGSGMNMARLKGAVGPFIMRRLKTDKRIIDDLPEKNEIVMRLTPTKPQRILYNEIVDGYEAAIASKENRTPAFAMTAIIKLKMVLNHPDQYLGETAYETKDSAKFMLLEDLARTIHENREHLLVFSQFKEIIPHLAAALEKVYGKEGLVITGETPIGRRQEMVDRFQAGAAPFMVLSLRAAGVGLNLTRAENVIHFDRWWNPAVEDQATDRTFRIGQTRNVTVYKFITSDTIEESIDNLISRKRKLSDDVLGDVSSNVVATLTPEQILEAMRFRGGME